jgi:nitroimidazol reductase NimA-like FMN-containing flavoprotein (pyridoxamine 5'-phosphate oxidase superfamily)
MEPYHLRRTDKEMTDPDEMARVLGTTRTIALALCRHDEPYLVTLNHGYDRERRCLYFHCAPSGKKVDVIRANPRCWGMAVEDLGYQDGACDHAYRSVMFGGRVELLEDDDAKRVALEVMIRQQESDPERVMAEQLTPARVAAVTIGRIDIETLTGKEGLPG